MQVVGGLPRLPFGGPQPTGGAECLPGLVPRRIVGLEGAVDGRESVEGLVLAEPPGGRARAGQVGGADEIPRGELQGLQAAVVGLETVDLPEPLPVLRRHVRGLAQAGDLGLGPRLIGAALAQKREVLAMTVAQERVELAQQLLPIRDVPVPLEHLLRGRGVGHAQHVERVSVAQRVGEGRGEQARRRVRRHRGASPAQVRRVMLVEVIPLAFLPRLAHVSRRGRGSLRTIDRRLDPVRHQRECHEDDREPHGEGNLGEDVLNHDDDCARSAVTYTSQRTPDATGSPGRASSSHA